MTSLLLLALLVQDPFRVAARNYTLEFENDWVKIARVRYKPHDKTVLHDHPSAPVVYVYVTDGGRLKFAHEEYGPMIRKPVQAGALRYNRGRAEKHTVEELDGVSSEYLRVELKTKPVDLPERDIRRAPEDRTPFISNMIRILHVTCQPLSTCPASEHPEDPAVLIYGRQFQWQAPGLALDINGSGMAMEQVRIELVSRP
jgi:hypothetical protein